MFEWLESSLVYPMPATLVGHPACSRSESTIGRYRLQGTESVGLERTLVCRVADSVAIQGQCRGKSQIQCTGSHKVLQDFLAAVGQIGQRGDSSACTAVEAVRSHDQARPGISRSY